MIAAMRYHVRRMPSPVPRLHPDQRLGASMSYQDAPATKLQYSVPNFTPKCSNVDARFSDKSVGAAVVVLPLNSEVAGLDLKQHLRTGYL